MIELDGSLTRLEEAVKERGGGAYVMTVSTDGRPHVTYAPVRWAGDRDPPFSCALRRRL
jgi:hypothetical protein